MVAAQDDHGGHNDPDSYSEYADCDEEEEEYLIESSLWAKWTPVALANFDEIAWVIFVHFDGLGGGGLERSWSWGLEEDKMSLLSAEVI